MTRYFFHVHNGISILDDIGLELPDITAAQAAAIELTRKILDEPDGPLWQDHSWRVEVSGSPRGGGEAFLMIRISVARRNTAA